MTFQDCVAHIEQRQSEIRVFCAEQRALNARDSRTPWIYPLGGIAAGTTLFGAGMMFARLLG